MADTQADTNTTQEYLCVSYYFSQCKAFRSIVAGPPIVATIHDVKVTTILCKLVTKYQYLDMAFTQV